MRIVAVAGATRREREDAVATEEPLEIRVAVGGATHSLAITMRTPGHDFDLAAGFLHTEGAVRDRARIAGIKYCGGAAPAEQNYNIVTVHLRDGEPFDMDRFSRHVFTSSSCGICGKATLEQVRANLPADRAPAPMLKLDPELLGRLPAKLRQEQKVFDLTGGLHAAALFDLTGKLLLAREDVGRHNALDKLIGALLLADALPAPDRILLVSGRASFELVQKALMAGIPVLAAVGAPSSLAVELAREFGLTLIGFLRADRYNLYTAPRTQ